MDDIRYIISDASKLVNVEQHTLRYWQDELELDIPRNEMGHRYYREEDISTLKKIKALKDHGFQLKAIKMVLPDLDKFETLDPASLMKLMEKVDGQEAEKEQTMEKSEEKTEMDTAEHGLTNPAESADRMGQFREIMKDIIGDVFKENNVELSDTVSMNVTNSVIKEMDYLIRMKEERDEERYKQFDRTLREYQNSKSHSAASKEHRFGKKKMLFRKTK